MFWDEVNQAVGYVDTDERIHAHELFRAALERRFDGNTVVTGLRNSPEYREVRREGIELQWVDTNVEPNRILTFDEVAALGLDGTGRST
jgi:hypothetical protein